MLLVLMALAAQSSNHSYEAGYRDGYADSKEGEGWTMRQVTKPVPVGVHGHTSYGVLLSIEEGDIFQLPLQEVDRTWGAQQVGKTLELRFMEPGEGVLPFCQGRQTRTHPARVKEQGMGFFVVDFDPWYERRGDTIRLTISEDNAWMGSYVGKNVLAQLIERQMQ